MTAMILKLREYLIRSNNHNNISSLVRKFKKVKLLGQSAAKSWPNNEVFLAQFSKQQRDIHTF
jgi:hypothetical protein